MPDSGRHLHAAPLPKLGGVALFLAFYASVLFLFVIRWMGFDFDLNFSLRPAVPILISGLIVLALGAWDDVHGLGPYPKLIVQSLAALLLFAGKLRVHRFIMLFGNHDLPWFVDLPLTIFWVVAITNAFNLIDGIDGLAAGSALFSTVVVFVVALVNHASLASLMTIGLSGAILGFLHYNFNPATIFLGDSGSLFIGFVLSALALQSAEKAPTIVAVTIPVVSFGLPILETILSVLRRWMAGRPVFGADQEHIHHKLLAQGLSQRQVVIILYGVSAIFGLLSLFLLRPTGSAIALVLVVLGSGIWIGIQQLGYLEFGELRRVAQRTLEQHRVFTNDIAVRRAIEELKQPADYRGIYTVLVAAFSDNDFDGFDLHLYSGFAPFPDMQIAENHGLYDEGLCFRWRKPDLEDHLGDSWRINLDLVSNRGTQRASMTLYRCYHDRALKLDVNLLTSEFPGVLADALSRAQMNTRRIPAVVAPTESETATAVAEAG